MNKTGLERLTEWLDKKPALWWGSPQMPSGLWDMIHKLQAEEKQSAPEGLISELREWSNGWLIKCREDKQGKYHLVAREDMAREALEILSRYNPQEQDTPHDGCSNCGSRPGGMIKVDGNGDCIKCHKQICNPVKTQGQDKQVEVKLNSRLAGKTIEQFANFQKAIEEGKKALFVGMEFVCMPHKDYMELTSVTQDQDKPYPDTHLYTGKEAQEIMKKEKPVNLLELKLWVIKERDRAYYSSMESFFTALCNKIDELTVRPAPVEKMEVNPLAELGGAHKVNPLHHSEKCPASKGGYICTCGGYYNREETPSPAYLVEHEKQLQEAIEYAEHLKRCNAELISVVHDYQLKELHPAPVEKRDGFKANIPIDEALKRLSHLAENMVRLKSDGFAFTVREQIGVIRNELELLSRHPATEPLAEPLAVAIDKVGLWSHKVYNHADGTWSICIGTNFRNALYTEVRFIGNTYQEAESKAFKYLRGLPDKGEMK